MTGVMVLQVPVTKELNERIVFAAKQKKLTKRDYIAAVLEEKLDEHRSQAGTNETGNHEGDQ